MPLEFKFPDVGEGITEGEIVKWLVKEGDDVKQDQPIAEVETDKAIVEIPAPQAGVILKIHHKAGDTVKVGEILVTIGNAGEKASEKKEKPAERESKQLPDTSYRMSTSVVGEIPEEEIIIKQGVSQQTERGKKIATTPAVRRLARELGVDIATMKGTGLDGRITEEDVRKASGKPSEEVKEDVEEEPEEVKETGVKVVKKYDLYGYIEHVPLKGVRKAIAKNMVKSKYTAPHVTHMDEAYVDDLFHHREKEKRKLEEQKIHLTFMPFVIKACIAALKKHPYANASLDDEHEEIILKKYYNIGVAVDTPDGLMVPVIKEANTKPIIQMAKEIQELAEKAKNRKLDLADLKGGTFTITNVGSLGGVFATPIINWPEVAILATGKIQDRAVPKGGKITIRKVLPLSLSFDHRVIDGAEAAKFVNDIKKYLEDVDLLLMEGDDKI